MIDIYSLSTNELVAKLRSGDISSVEVCNAYIDRINKYEKDVKAWSFLDKKILLEKAEEAFVPSVKNDESETESDEGKTQESVDNDLEIKEPTK